MTRIGEPFSPATRARHEARAGRDGVPAAALAMAILATIVVVGGMVSSHPDPARLRQWSTVFLALVLQALPFLVLGTVLAGLVSAYLRPALVARLVPRSPVAAVGVAGLAGAALPGCECSSVPLARRLAARGVPTPAALSFLLAAPAVNPVVVVATLVAFPGRPEMAMARWLAALATSMTVGLLWTRWGRPLPLTPETTGIRPWRVMLHTVVDDTSTSRRCARRRRRARPVAHSDDRCRGGRRTASRRGGRLHGRPWDRAGGPDDRRVR